MRVTAGEAIYQAVLVGFDSEKNQYRKDSDRLSGAFPRARGGAYCIARGAGTVNGWYSHIVDKIALPCLGVFAESRRSRTGNSVDSLCRELQNTSNQSWIPLHHAQSCRGVWKQKELVVGEIFGCRESLSPIV